MWKLFNNLNIKDMANTNIYPFGQNEEVPTGYPIVNDLTTGGADKALSAQMGVELNKKFTQYVDFSISRYAQLNSYINVASPHAWIYISNHTCKLIPVSSGETYRITAGENGSRIAVLTTNSTSGNASFATGYDSLVVLNADEVIESTIPSNGHYLYVAMYNTQDISPAKVEKLEPSNYEVYKTEVAIDDFAPQKLFININTNNWLAGNNGYKCVLIPVLEGQRYKITANNSGNAYYAVLDSSNTFTTGTAVAYATGWDNCGRLVVGTSDYITIPNDGALLYIAISSGAAEPYTNNKPSLWRLFDDVAEMIDEMDVAASASHIPNILKVDTPTNIIYTIDDFMLAHEGYSENDGGTLKISCDLGKTWHSLANTYGNITNTFFFSDGTLMFCMKDDNGCGAYWVKDFDNMTVNACTILDYNGPFVPSTSETRFYNVDRARKRTYVNGVEYYLFGDYAISTGNPRLWYSCDNGRTIRCAFAFGYSEIDGNVVRARHIHGFIYNKYDGYFYALTGDHEYDGGSECNIMRGRHDANHVWTWELLKSGQEYKLVAPTFDEGNMYCVTDYTDASLVNKKGIVSLPISSLDFADMRYLFRATKEFMKEGSYYSDPSDSQVAAMASYVSDNNGWRIVGSDYQGNSKLMIAKGGHNFVWVDNTAGLKLRNWFGPNNNGDVYAFFRAPNPASATSGDAWLRVSHAQSYNVTEIMRNSGATDFFEGWKGTEY